MDNSSIPLQPGSVVPDLPMMSGVPPAEQNPQMVGGQPTVAEMPIEKPDIAKEVNRQRVKSNIMFGLKALYILILNVVILSGGVYVVKNFVLKPDTENAPLAQARYKMTTWKGYGEVFEPLMSLPVYYGGKGFVEEEFLLDSGALVSSMPREKAEEMGQKLSFLKRATFAGFGGTTSFAYNGEFKTKLGDKEVTLPVVFTEATGTKMILGRLGFFESYSVNFNADERTIVIKD